MKYRIQILPAALEMLARIKDRRIQGEIRGRIDALREEPEKQGKPLSGELSGYRSLCASGQRYRIIYRVDRGKVIVFVVALGIRKERDKKDIYELARKLIRFRLLNSP